LLDKDARSSLTGLNQEFFSTQRAPDYLGERDIPFSSYPLQNLPGFRRKPESKARLAIGSRRIGGVAEQYAFHYLEILGACLVDIFMVPF
jgi:hypothetical protein